ncbi:GNAT family N-acetyltransferase [Pseudonocardia sp. EV170527-09]|uniref:GNAT family N-acetyltransferase n=1 Tax=Pseudonocardia sp. EV170527-09 TaxID=2603411 RepID=UPI0011F0B0D1|nr:GNAT family N-acetyltransferase [Pseudonocardia sp. EV170527-09]KAA1034977.1 GNAT family N-acetyltransferase [Pseudonocardia sp. EV170527-09]
MEIDTDDLSGAEVQGFLAAHVADMHAQGSPESTHALDLDGLRGPRVTLWVARDDDGTLLGCGALSTLAAGAVPEHPAAEIKSMRTAEHARGRGVGAAVLTRLLDAARERGHRAVYLETGSGEYWAPARRLYERFGFVRCPPFADYPVDPLSAHYRREV